MKKIIGGTYIGERAMFGSVDLEIENATFTDGESPLKESSHIKLVGCSFGWKYPLWYSSKIELENTELKLTARSGIWYTHGIEMHNCRIIAPKTFRRSSGISLFDVSLENAEETMWNCSDITLKNVTVNGDYFAMGSENILAENITVNGNYLFDGCKNIVIKNSTLISKDAFWNCENVTAENCHIVGEYLAWNSKNVKLINCTVDSNQGLCYMKNATLVNCDLLSTDLCFEFSEVDAEINSHIVSIKQPYSGRVVAASIGETVEAEKRFCPYEDNEGG